MASPLLLSRDLHPARVCPDSVLPANVEAGESSLPPADTAKPVLSRSNAADDRVPDWTQVAERLRTVLATATAPNAKSFVQDRGGSTAVPASHLSWSQPETSARLLQSDAATFFPQQSTLLAASIPSKEPETAELLLQELLQRLRHIEQHLETTTSEEDFAVALQAAGQAVSPPAVVRKFLSLAREVTQSWGAAFFLKAAHLDECRLKQISGMSHQVVIPQPVRSQSSPDDQAIRSHQCITVSSAAPERDWLPTECAAGCVVPLLTSVGCLGTLWCFDRRQRDWSLSEQRRLHRVATSLALALERSALLRDSDARRRMSQELSCASLHHSSQAVGQLSTELGIDVAIRTASSAELGGDLCEVWPVPGNRTFFAIGDATGHGVPAAMMMAVARGSLRTLLDSEVAARGDAVELTQRLNRALHSVTQGEQFLTFLCGFLDRQRGMLTYTNGGHPPPWLIRQGQATPLSNHGMLLGVLPDSRYEAASVQLQTGDWFLAYTDGISEALSPQRELFRPSGILAAMNRGHWASATKAADAIWNAVAQHRTGLPAEDDQTLLVIRIT